MRVRAWSGVIVVVAVGLAGAGCPSTGVPDDEDHGGQGREGDACITDTDCEAMLCVGGVCTTQGGSSSGMASSGSSGGTSSSGVASSSGALDGGTQDAHVPGGRIVTDPDSSSGPVEFGATRLGATVTQNVLVTNLGDAAATIITLGFRNNLSGEFTLSVVGTQPAALAPNEQMTLRITHTATDATADNAFLTIVTNAANPLVEVPLNASFKGDPVVTLTDEPLAGTTVTTFQMTPTPVGTPVTAHLYVKNTGQADSALSVTSVALNPAVSALFSVAAGTLPRAISAFPGACADLAGCGPGAGACVDSLCFADSPQGAWPIDVIDIAVTFNAGEAGEHQIELVVVADVAGQPQTHRVQIAALAQDSRVNVSPNPIAFGTLFVGRSSSVQVTLENPSDASSVLEVTGLDIRFTPSPYELQLGGVTFPYPLTPGSSVVATIVFSPQNPGNFGNSLAITRNNGLPINVPITGNCVNEPEAVVPSSLDFGGVIPGSPRSLPLTIRNTGFGPLSVSSISVTPTTAPFTVVPVSVTEVAPNASADVTVTYSPATVGASDSATLLLETNDPDRALIQVALSGQGVMPGADVTPESGVDFGSVLVGISPAPTRTITVRNGGQGNLVVDSPLVVRDSANVGVPQYEVTASRPLPASVSSGDAMTFTLTFTPAQAIHYNGSIVLTTNDPTRPTFTIPVVGAGNNCSALPNTTVVVVDGTECAYQCVANAVGCADESCVVCPARHAATPSCGSGNACLYTCPPNTGEAIDPPSTCSRTNAHFLGNVQDGSSSTTTAFRLYPASDGDWFRFVAKDRTDMLNEGFLPLTAFRAYVRLSGVPTGERFAFELVTDSCGGGGTPSVVNPGERIEITSVEWCDTWTWDDVYNTPDNPDDDVFRVIDDSREFYVHVYPLGDSYACTSYTLEVEVEEPFFNQWLCMFQ